MTGEIGEEVYRGAQVRIRPENCSVPSNTAEVRCLALRLLNGVGASACIRNTVSLVYEGNALRSA